MKKITLRSYCAVLITGLLLLNTVNSYAISIIEEKKLADKFMKQVTENQMVMNDPIVNNMVKKVGEHLVSLLPPQPFDYSFNVVDADVFNAFATVGANIFFYRGLITSMDSIDEFAGIAGHEIAHAASRHVSESIDRSKYLNIGSLLGVLAGVIIGGQSDAEAGSAVIQGSVALSQTAMLSFTRENEIEADEKGVMFLKKSCFSPQGLMAGLIKIRESDFRGVESIPDYVKTHPGTNSRIAHVENLLSGSIPSKNKPACEHDFRFDMVKYRLLGEYADIDTTLELLKTKLEKDPSNPAIHYGLGLVYARKFMRQEAIAHLQKALSINVFDPMILLELGRLYLLDGKPEKSLNVLSGIDMDPVLGVMARYHQAEAQFELKEYHNAKNGFKWVINKQPSLYPTAYLKLANILSLEQQIGLSAYNLGLYYSKIKKIKTAVIHLKRAVNNIGNEEERKKAKKLLDKLERKIAKEKELQFLRR